MHRHVLYNCMSIIPIDSKTLFLSPLLVIFFIKLLRKLYLKPGCFPHFFSLVVVSIFLFYTLCPLWGFYIFTAFSLVDNQKKT